MPASEERSIHEFPSAMSILATTLFLVSTASSGSTSGYDSEKTTAGDLALAILGDFEFTQDLFTNVKTIFGAINSIMCLYGHNIPSGSQGTDGQFYVKYTTSGGVDTVDGLYWKINNAWVEVSTGGGGGGASVTLGTTVPSDATGSNGDLYVQYDSVTYAVIEYFVKINNSWRKSPYSRVVALTQAEYDLITPDTTTFYIITDKQGGYVKLPVITDAYDSTATYNTGDFCIYNDTFYKCNTDNTTGTWDAQYWDATSVADEINELNTNKADDSDIPTKTSDLINDSGFPVATNVSWGQSLSVNYIKSNFLLFVGNRLFALWFYGSGYANVDIRNLGTNDASSGTGSVTMDIITVTRTANGFTVTTTSQATLTVIG